MKRIGWLAILVGCVAVAACTGGGDDDDDGSPTPTASPSPSPSPSAWIRLDMVVPSNGLATAVLPGVLLHGTGFSASTAATVGTAAAMSCTAPSAVDLRCDFPAGSPGRRSVTVADPTSGTFTLSSAFTWTGVRNETDAADEADFCNVQFPTTTTTSVGVPTESIYGQIFEAGVTDAYATPAPGILAQLGYGPSGTSPTTSNAWRFFTATTNGGFDFSNNNDEYVGTLTVASAGTYGYAYRFSFDGGIHYTYCDLDGAGSNATLTFSSAQTGTLTVTP